VLAHLVQREQAFFLDGLADRALGHAVAAADLVGVRHGGRLVVPLMAGVADVGLAEHQLVADVGDRAALAQQLEIPAAVHRVAVQAGTDELVVLDDELLVHAGKRVAQDDLLGAFAAQELPGAEEVDARDLELGGGQRAGVAADAEHRQVIGRHLGLLEQRRDQPVGDAPVRRAFAHAVDACVGHRLHRVVDDDAAVHVQAHGLGQFGVGTDPHGHHDEVGRDLGAVLELQGPDPALGRGLPIFAACLAAVPVADQRLGLAAHDKAQAAIFQ
jgi:hypothetical protein